MTENTRLDEVLQEIGATQVSTLIVDPARKYYEGDEDSSDAVSGYFTKIESFAKEKNAAAILLHHLKRGAQPRNVADIADCVRGSGVWLDRPRVILGLHRTASETQFGISARNGIPQHAFPSATMFSGVRRFRHDEATSRGILVEAATAAAPRTVAPEAARVLAAASGIILSGARLTRTGKTGLFERKPAKLAGTSRAAVRTAIDTLISQGSLDCDADGALTLPAPPSAAPAELNSATDLLA